MLFMTLVFWQNFRLKNVQKNGLFYTNCVTVMKNCIYKLYLTTSSQYGYVLDRK